MEALLCEEPLLELGAIGLAVTKAIDVEFLQRRGQGVLAQAVDDAPELQGAGSVMARPDSTEYEAGGGGPSEPPPLGEDAGPRGVFDGQKREMRWIASSGNALMRSPPLVRSGRSPEDLRRFSGGGVATRSPEDRKIPQLLEVSAMGIEILGLRSLSVSGSKEIGRAHV